MSYNLFLHKNMCSSKIVLLFIANYSTKCVHIYRIADKSLARLGRKQATATEDFEFHISYL